MTVSAMEQAVLIDAATVLFALSPEDPRSAACQEQLLNLASGRSRGYVSAEVIQEVVFHRMRRTQNRAQSVAEGRGLMRSFAVLKFDNDVLDTSLRLIEQLPNARGRDAIHAATALVYGITTILSPDKDFDGIPGITRIDPIAD